MAQGAGETRLSRILPGGDAAVDQTNLMWKLAGFAYDQLGRYRATFHEPWATDVRRFGERVAAIEAELAAADARRRIKYDFLRPSRIINSVSDATREMTCLRTEVRDYSRRASGSQ